MIDYAKIIETANRRKETLQQIEASIPLMAVVARDVEAALGEAKAAQVMWVNLDDEGRALLPKSLRTALGNTREVCSRLEAAAAYLKTWRELRDGATGEKP